jgi:hypothetical protein
MAGPLRLLMESMFGTYQGKMYENENTCIWYALPNNYL